MMGAFGSMNQFSQLSQGQAARSAQQQAYLSALNQAAAQQQMLAQQARAAQMQQAQMAAYNSATTSSGTSNSYLYFAGTTSSTATAASTTSSGSWLTVPAGSTITTGTLSAATRANSTYTIQDGYACKIELPDGTIIDVKADGSFEIKDQGAKTIYRASRIRDFNPFLNASDKLEDFIRYCGEEGVRKDEMLNLPIKLFIGWLILEAAKADREPEPDVKLLPDLRRHAAPRCPGCGRFTGSRMRARRIEFCAPVCFDRHYRRVAVPALTGPDRNVP